MKGSIKNENKDFQIYTFVVVVTIRSVISPWNKAGQFFSILIGSFSSKAVKIPENKLKGRKPIIGRLSSKEERWQQENLIL